MADATVFSRGSSVLDYWLAHAEGMTVRPLDAVVERVIATAPSGRAKTLVVRPRGTRRLREIPADAIAAVEPAAQCLLLERRTGPGRMHRAASSAGNGAGAVWSAASWLRPRAVRAVVEGVRLFLLGALTIAQLTGAGAVLVLRAAYVVATRGWAALDEHRARRRRSQPAQ